MTGRPPQPEGGYGWVIVVCSGVVNVMFGAMRTCFVVYMPDLSGYFQRPQAQISIIGSLDLAIVYLMGTAGADSEKKRDYVHCKLFHVNSSALHLSYMKYVHLIMVYFFFIICILV